MKKFISPVLAGFLLIACLSGIYSCMKDMKLKKIAGVEWNPTLAVPLIYSNITVKDILYAADKSNAFSIDANNFVTLIYKGNLLSLSADEVLNFQDLSTFFDTTLSPADVALLNVSGVTIVMNETITLPMTGNSRADSLFLKKGTLTASISSFLPNSGSLTISVPSSVPVMSITLPFSYSGSSPVVATDSISLAGAEFILNPVNQLPVTFALTLNSSATPATTFDNVHIDFSINGIKFSKLFGYIDQQILSPYSDTVAVDIFNNSLGGGTFTLVDPKMFVYISNSYGVPIQANFDIFQGYNINRTPTTFDILGPGIPNPLPINSPGITQVGQSVSSTFALTKDNSNIVSVIDDTPPYIIYKVFSKSNPSGPPTPPNTNFVLDSSNFKVDIEIQLPLWGTARGFTLQDTLENFSLPDAENIDFFLLRLHVENGYPCDVKVQVYFADENYSRLDSLITSAVPVILISADVDGNGVVTGPPKVKDLDFLIEKERMAQLTAMKHVLVRGDAYSTNNAQTNVKIYANYRLFLKLGAKTKLHLKL